MISGKIEQSPSVDQAMPSHSLTAILQQIERRLHEALQELFPPLSDLARAHVRDAQPLVRAAIVLTAAASLQASAEDQDRDEASSIANARSLHEQAIILGSALEMLSVALSIHRLLLLPAKGDSPVSGSAVSGSAVSGSPVSDGAPTGDNFARDTLDKALVGSTILAGDYCFSRAASMAAETESPRVVDLFSQALQQVSEMSLRGLLDGGESATENPFEEDVILASAGVEAICALVNAGEERCAAEVRLAQAIANRNFSAAADQIAALPHGAEAWRALLVWSRASLAA